MSRKHAGPETPTVDWRGASGKIYRYWVYPLPARFEPGQVGNYIHARWDDGHWVPLYIGEGDLHEAAQRHPQAARLAALGATHLHANQGGLHQVRRDEAADLLAAHPEARDPAGANAPRRGGRKH